MEPWRRESSLTTAHGTSRCATANAGVLELAVDSLMPTPLPSFKVEVLPLAKGADHRRVFVNCHPLPGVPGRVVATRDGETAAGDEHGAPISLGTK